LHSIAEAPYDGRKLHRDGKSLGTAGPVLASGTLAELTQPVCLRLRQFPKAPEALTCRFTCLRYCAEHFAGRVTENSIRGDLHCFVLVSPPKESVGQNQVHDY